MRKLLQITCLLCCCAISHAQDFTNKGKDFWLGYGDHVRMHDVGDQTNNQNMVLYITSEQTTNFKVEIPLLGWSYSGTVSANNVVSTIPIPKTGPQDARLNQEGKFDKGIHVTSDKPVVAYMHIYSRSVSGAGILFPTNTLGREYISINYTQASNEASISYSFFFVVATEDNTVVEIIPSQNTLGGRAANVVFTETLNKGQVYNVMSNADLTGSTIKSIATNTASCKRIAVFSGSGKISIPGNGSGDNFIQQAFPGNAWGKKYITIPTQSQPNNFFRIVKKNPSTTVRLDGGLILPVAFVNGVYYEFGPTNQPHVIEADDAIMVAQYTASQGQYGNSNTAGDPEMIYLSPVEQTVTNAILNSTPNFQITGHYVSVIMRTGTTNSFTIDGINYSTSFLPVPADPAYSYLSTPVAQGQHTLRADSGFNAIAYGFGLAESYGYSAGTNLKDLYQFVSIQNDFGTVSFPAGCKGTPFKFSMTFPYQPTQIKWIFGTALNAFGVADTTINSPVADSTWVVNGRTLYRYKLNKTYSIPQMGTYPITIVANNPTTDGCSGLQEIDYDLQIFDPPVADFNFTHNGCVSDSVRFLDNTNGLGRQVVRWYWDFGDAASSTIANPTHKYATAGAKTVRHFAITDVGCFSDTVSRVVPISDPPVAKFGIGAPFCEKSVITFTDSSTVSAGALVNWRWNFGDNTTINATNGNPVQHTYTNAGNYTVTLEVETNTGCRSLLYSRTITVYPKPLANFDLPSACLPNAFAQFNDRSTIADATQNLFTYLWDFGDGNTSTQRNPINRYYSTGPFNVRLTVTSNNGCIDDSLRVLNSIYPQPKINVSAPAEKCFGDSVRVAVKINQPAGLKISEYTFDWSNDAPTTAIIPAGADSIVVYHVFSNPGNQSVTVFVRGEGPGACLSDTLTLPIYINRRPLVNYDISTIVCEGQQVNFTDRSTVADGIINKWTWVLGNGNNSALQNPNTTYTTPGSYTSSLVVESSKGCVSSKLSKPVLVNYLPMPNFETPEVCLSDPFAQFTDSSTIGDNSQLQFTYLWNFGDPNANAGNPNTSNLKNPQHRYIAVGNYTVALTVTSKDGCVQSLSKPFTVNGSVPLAGYTVNNASTLCANKDVAITDASTVDFGSIVKVEIYWDYGNDPTIKTVEEDPTPGKSYTHKYPDFGTPATRSYSIRYVAYSGINCINEITRTITVNASPQIVFDPMNLVCEEVPPFPITAAREIFGFTGTGIFSGPGIVAPSGTFSPAAAKPGIHTIRYSFMATNGCSTFADQTIRVAATPLLDAGPDRFVLEGGFITLQPKASGDNISYLWTPSIGLDNPRIAAPKASPTEDITYRLTVTSEFGCKKEDDVFVKVLKKPRVPNAFSPNGDGINDTWIIEHLDSYPGATVEVYNRYGQLVYRSVGYGKPWDGTYHGSPLPVATYYWIINPKNGREQMNGSVTIIR
jgi:gliding motility-associated-like protein